MEEDIKTAAAREIGSGCFANTFITRRGLLNYLPFSSSLALTFSSISA